MQHELGTNKQKSAMIRHDREIFSHVSYKKGTYMLWSISSKMNVPRKAAMELILQLECCIARGKQLR